MKIGQHVVLHGNSVPPAWDWSAVEIMEIVPGEKRDVVRVKSIGNPDNEGAFMAEDCHEIRETDELHALLHPPAEKPAAVNTITGESGQ